MEKRIRFNGFYPYRCDRAEYDRLNADTAYREETFTRLMVDEVRRWIALAEERLAGTGIRCFVMPGNDDEFAIDEALESTTVVNPDNRVVRVGDDVADALVLVDEPHAVGQPRARSPRRSCSSGSTAWPPSSTPASRPSSTCTARRTARCSTARRSSPPTSRSCSTAASRASSRSARRQCAP